MRKLKDLKPCDYEKRAKEHGTLRKHWEDASAKDLMWLLTHPNTTIPRRRLVGITLKTLSVCEHVTPAASKACLLDLQRWVDGEEVDLKAVYAAAYAACSAARSAAVAAAYAAAYAADAARAARVSAAADDAYAYAAADDAADAAADAAYAYAAADAAYAYAAADAVRTSEYDKFADKLLELLRGCK